MFRVDELILNEEAVLSIEPSAENNGIHVTTKRGAVIVYDGVDFSSVVAEMEREGLLTMSPEEGMDPGLALDISAFTQEELRQMSEATSAGFRYAAKDVDGKVFAYRGRPRKDSYGWSLKPGDYFRLKGEFAVLSWDDAEPLDIFSLTEMPR